MALSGFGNRYSGLRVLITGHTGFKGSWLALWLRELGAEVSGIALDPETSPNHWNLLGLEIDEYRHDIRDADAVARMVKKVQPEIVFHLAAQPLVRRSYRAPLETWATNVMGTAHVLEACRHAGSVKAIVAVTTDKVYANHEWSLGYRECDRLGGNEPYSASKAACEILIESYRRAFFEKPGAPLLASARAGNVIGGGDWSEDRLLPDVARAVSEGSAAVIRSPAATRPWQHVLDCLAGYLLLGRRLVEGDAHAATAWNFGPATEGNRTVADVLALLKSHWPCVTWRKAEGEQPPEAGLLHLDSTRAHAVLGWESVWDLEQAVRATAEWYRDFYADGSVGSVAQLRRYVSDAHAHRTIWAG